MTTISGEKMLKIHRTRPTNSLRLAVIGALATLYFSGQVAADQDVTADTADQSQQQRQSPTGSEPGQSDPPTDESPTVERPDPRLAADISDRIIVTGSSIAGASDSGTIAVSTLTAEQLESYGQVSTGELLENLPQAGSFEINDSADGPNAARGDVSTVNLRGLGSGNTLILLNGRRIAPHAVFQDVSTAGAGAVPRSVTNVQAFPADAIDRVEVLRDGASALYGSDAVAGVINTILSPAYDGTRITVRGSTLEGTNEEELKVDFATGLQFNNGATNVIVNASFFTRDGLFASELGPQFNNVDKRALLESRGSPWAASNQFRNTSTRSPFGQFRVGELLEDGTFSPIDVGELTARNGNFHVQPCGFAGSLVNLGTFDPLVGDVCLDDGSLNTTLRFDFNAFQPVDSFGEGQEVTLDSRSARGRQLISDADRYNFYTMAQHDFDNGVQLFGEFLFYRSETQSQRATQPLDDGLAFILVPRTNFWNPVGAITSPNRVEDINAPDEGLDVLIARWRPTELGPRVFSVDSTAFRTLAGARGEYRGWDWESALSYSENHVTDTSNNRMSKTLLQEQLALSTPDAINPFGGPNANSQEQLDRIRISVSNKGKTELGSWDFRASNASLLDNWAGSIGAAFGTEIRYESYDDDRDPRLDGTITFDAGDGGVSDSSDVVGVSPTFDSDGDRTVYAAFGELLIPLVAPSPGLWTNEVNLQLAARAQYFDDIEDFVVKPKFALSWFPIDAINFRAAYSEGFRAPNLVQLNRGNISRLNQGIVDFIRSDVTNDPDDTGETFRATVRSSNPDLDPEESETIVVGMTFKAPFADDLTFSIDYWNIDQNKIIGTLGPEVILALDALSLRDNGIGDPRVIRDILTDVDQAQFDAFNAANPDDQRVPVGKARAVVDTFINQDSQETEGIDLGISGSFDFNRFGRLRYSAEASRLLTFDLNRANDIDEALQDPQFGEVFGREFDSLAVDRRLLNGNPDWRLSANFGYRLGKFGSSTSIRYVSSFKDTRANNIDVTGDGENDFFDVDSWTRVNTFVDYRFDVGPVQPFRLRFGVNNVFDKQPPLADDGRGFNSSVHSVRGREYYLQLRADL